MVKHLEGLKEQAFDTLKSKATSWLITKVVEQAVVKVVAALFPATGAAAILKTLYDGVGRLLSY